jgi:hypothetical protein
VGVPKFPKLGFSQLWGPITLCVDFWLRWGLKQSCSSHQDPSKGMWRTTCMQVNRGNSLLLVVGSQTANLTFDPSFAHNLCFKCPNGSCKPIFDIYTPRVFQWYKELLNPMGFDPYNCSQKIRESNSQSGSSLGSVRVHSFTLSYTPENMRCHSWAFFLAFILAKCIFDEIYFTCDWNVWCSQVMHDMVKFNLKLCVIDVFLGFICTLVLFGNW